MADILFFDVYSFDIECVSVSVPIAANITITIKIHTHIYNSKSYEFSSNNYCYFLKFYLLNAQEMMFAE